MSDAHRSRRGVAAAGASVLPMAICAALALGGDPARAPSPALPADPLQSLAFLEGSWDATADAGPAKTSGRYTFVRELDRHVLARHSTTDVGCRGPVTFDCAHGDLLYVFQDAVGQPLKAIYLDNEGHVIHYAVTVPSTDRAEFLSEPNPGPRFRLIYELDGKVMKGRFQMQPPGGGEWRSYLEWSGSRS